MIYFDENGNAFGYQISDAVFSCKEEEWYEYSKKRNNKDYKVTSDGFVDIEPTLDELKEAKRQEINAERDKAEQGGFEYMGKIFDSDPISCQRMSCAAQAMQLVAMSEQSPTITWTTQDNSTIDLNPQQLLGLVATLAQHSNKCHEKATELKKKVDLAITPEELEKIVWE